MTDQNVSGTKYFRLLDDLLEQLRPVGTSRDRAGNRQLFFDQYAALLVLYYFNPAVTTLRGIQKFTTLEKLQKAYGIRPTALGSLSEAAQVFDPKALEPIIAQLAQQAVEGRSKFVPPNRDLLAGLTAIDGSLLRALPRMAWALWQDATNRAAKIHVAFAVFPGVPVGVTVTHGSASERQEMRNLVKPGGFYVVDRGYADYDMFKEFQEQGVRFLGRVQENTAFEVHAERALTEADKSAGVVRDITLRRLGTEKHNALLKEPLRMVEVRGSEPGQTWLLVTNALDLPAQLVMEAYRYRWHIELFFRWLKCVLGCRHLLSQSHNGVTIQVYCAIIASLLIGLWMDAKPDKRTFEMLCHYFNGWASAKEVESHIKSLKEKRKPSS